MHTRVICLTGIVILLSAFGHGPLWAVTLEDVQALLDQYDKTQLIRAILKLRDNRITVYAKGRYMQFTGPPAPEFINGDTILMDLKQAGVDILEVKKALRGVPERPETATTLSLKSDQTVSDTPSTHVGPVVADFPETPEAGAEPSAETSVEQLAAIPEESGPTASGLASLRQAALECQMMEFLDYMSPSTQRRVQHFEAIHQDVENALGELYEAAHELYGDRIVRTEDAVRFQIEGQDPRWVDILGPQWAEMLARMPQETPFFLVQVTFGWTEECRVLQTFQACLEDPQFCTSSALEESSLRLEKFQGSWQIVEAKSPVEWEQAFRVGEGITEILGWAKAFIVKTNEKSIPYEDLMLSMANGYFQRIQGLIEEVSKVGAG